LTAGYKTLEILEKEKSYETLSQKSDVLFGGMTQNFLDFDIPVTGNSIESMGCFFFNQNPVSNYKAATESNTKLFSKYHKLMLENGVYLAPSQFEATFVSLAHSKEDLNKTLEIHRDVCKKLRS
jgi:glutamate-1-semialdehyde 2,1-aminomutase